MQSIYDAIVWNTLNSPAAAAKIAMGALSQLDRQMNQITRPLVQGARYENATDRQLDSNVQAALASGNPEEIAKAFAHIGQNVYHTREQTQQAPQATPEDAKAALKAMLIELGVEVK